MSRLRPPPSPDVRALLDRERVIPPVPASVRARAVARARAALAAGDVGPRTEASVVPRGRRWGLALAAASIASAAVGTAAYELGTHRRSAPNDHPAASAAVVASPTTTPPPAVVPSSPSAAPTIRVPHSTQAAPGPDELRLLRDARAAVARHDFAAALEPIGEHARRFRSGRLAEEREALRVRALAGLGRTEEARRAADAFEARFPRSVLLPAVSQMPAGGP
jgi:hypothetical protein